MILPDDKTRLQELINAAAFVEVFECDDKKKDCGIGGAMSAPAFWDDQENARKVGSENNRLKQTVC